ncbi:hypothetical protein A2Y47_00695 [Candidatus Giovannonibacteria bacterium RIFCSPLOWO2_12_43_8]|uniref:Uncharacterized protein n=1 Tax=Candidatus Giovannonibacteria bacterium RIFCSPLOWO2_12_43_8 TaxID=1798361 RepID=A0A1F5Y3H9_9BACT|nr:MAG: hypothetical protein A2Y47_00695 [Candidatus Giovannonibacteria bacterium RIFCSPLOWO2_12_43_8]
MISLAAVYAPKKLPQSERKGPCLSDELRRKTFLSLSFDLAPILNRHRPALNQQGGSLIGSPFLFFWNLNL